MWESSLSFCMIWGLFFPLLSGSCSPWGAAGETMRRVCRVQRCWFAGIHICSWCHVHFVYQEWRRWKGFNFVISFAVSFSLLILFFFLKKKLRFFYTFKAVLCIQIAVLEGHDCSWRSGGVSNPFCVRVRSFKLSQPGSLEERTSQKSWDWWRILIAVEGLVEEDLRVQDKVELGLWNRPLVLT